MAKTILVVVNPEQNIQMLLRHLEKVVKPGYRIVFLVEYQHDIPSWLLAHVNSLQTGFDQGLASEERRAWLSWDEQKTRAEKTVAEPARRAFGSIGAEVHVDLYWGSLNRAIQRYLDGSEIARILVGTSWLRRLKIAPTRVRNWLLRHRPNYASTPLTYPGDPSRDRWV
jgi:hypothetical protein